MVWTSLSGHQNDFSGTNVTRSGVISAGVIGLNRLKYQSGDASAWPIQNIASETARYSLSSIGWT